MSDAMLARALHAIVTDALGWLDDHPADQVDPAAVERFRSGVALVAPESLPAVVGLLVDLTWWLDTCADDEVDPDVAVKVLEGGVTAIDELPDGQRDRLLAVLADLAAVEPHAGRRYELRQFPFAACLIDDEPDDEPDDADAPPTREWIHPDARG